MPSTFILPTLAPLSQQQSWYFLTRPHIQNNIYQKKSEKFCMQPGLSMQPMVCLGIKFARWGNQTHHFITASCGWREKKMRKKICSFFLCCFKQCFGWVMHGWWCPLSDGWSVNQSVYKSQTKRLLSLGTHGPSSLQVHGVISPWGYYLSQIQKETSACNPWFWKTLFPIQGICPCLSHSIWIRPVWI